MVAFQHFCIEKIEKNNRSLFLQGLIKHMVLKDPSERLTAKEYMNTYRGKLLNYLLPRAKIQNKQAHLYANKC